MSDETIVYPEWKADYEQEKAQLKQELLPILHEYDDSVVLETLLELSQKRGTESSRAGYIERHSDSE